MNENEAKNVTPEIDGPTENNEENTSPVSAENISSENEILSEIKSLKEMFEKKIMVDNHKNSMFDNMHKELCDYKNGALEKNIDSMALDAIAILDTYEAVLNQDNIPETTAEALRNILQDINDMLYRQGIEMYSSIDEDMCVNTKSQKIIKIIDTNDETLNNKICAQIAPGYCKGERIIRAEKISIYKYKGE